MATDITMPKLSDTMTEGVLVEWRKSVGQQVQRGEVLAEIETDKANMELESFSSGVLLETRAVPGEKIAVGAVIAVIGAPGEKVAQPAEPAEEPESPAPPVAPKTPKTPKTPAPASWQPPPEPPHAPLEAGDVPERIREEPLSGLLLGPKASPLVRRLSREKGIDLEQVAGSGPGGRILREDLDRYPETTGKEEPASRTEAAGEIVPLSRMRSAIARKVLQAWQTTPHFTVTVEIDMAETERLSRELKGDGRVASLTDFIVKASALALKLHPEVNASFSSEGVIRHGSVDIGVAVALADGLVIPVIRGCDRSTLLQIAAENRRLAESARAGRISGEDLQGGTFTVSNMGMFGVDEFSAVINSPQAAILAVGAVMDRPCVRGGAVVAGRTMRVTLSADHRLLDGAAAARFLGELKRVLENPAPLLL